jgi:Sec7-like guanine-nucleotide exchange factor
MDALVETLSNLNEELSKDNDTLFTSRADAGELLNGISMSTSGTNQSSQQLNSTMQQVLAVLSDIKDFEERTANNTKNIQSSNLARGGVSNVGQ